MKRILCFGDSNTDGYSPDGGRYDDDVRWPGVLGALLGERFEVVVDAKNGRTIAFDDPYAEENCNGMNDIVESIKANEPLDMIIIMLGTNDLKMHFNATPSIVAEKLKEMCDVVKENSDAKILLMSPALLGDQIEYSKYHLEFGREQVDYSFDMGPQIQKVAKEVGADYLDVSLVAEFSSSDCLHFTSEAHQSVGKAVNDVVMKAFEAELKAEEEEARRKAEEEEARRKAEEEARRKAEEEEARRKAEEEARRKAEEEEARRKAEEEEARRKAEEEEARRKAEEEEARRKAEEEEARRKAEEEEARRKAEEEEEARRKAEEEEARRKAEEEEAANEDDTPEFKLNLEDEELFKSKESDFVIDKAEDFSDDDDTLIAGNIRFDDDFDDFPTVASGEELADFHADDSTEEEVRKKVDAILKKAEEEVAKEEQKEDIILKGEITTVDGISSEEAVGPTEDVFGSTLGSLSGGLDDEEEENFGTLTAGVDEKDSGEEDGMFGSHSSGVSGQQERMLSKKLYKDTDPSLIAARGNARRLMQMYDRIDSENLDSQRDALRKLFKSIGSEAKIDAPFRCDYGNNITIGDNFCAGFNCVILDTAEIKIGNNVTFGPGVQVYASKLPIDANVRNKGYACSDGVTIGDDVWVGGNVTIMPGVTIGNNVVIGAGSVVTKDIPDGVVAYGNPCTVQRDIDEEDKKFWDEKMIEL
nr:GDSL-type esterase/lipase family protein [Eubacterium xylanophilum]